MCGCVCVAFVYVRGSTSIYECECLCQCVRRNVLHRVTIYSVEVITKREHCFASCCDALALDCLCWNYSEYVGQGWYIAGKV